MSQATPLVFGAAFSEPNSDKNDALVRFTEALAARSGLSITAKACTYESLAAGMKDGTVSVGWLPPIVYLKASTVAQPLLRIQRGKDKTYQTALLVREDSPYKEPKDLRNARAAWVDPWSAAGFVMPRLWLLSHGVDPRTLFRAESFKWSHKAAVQAVVDGAADVCGTYASVNAEGALTSGGWSTVPEAKTRVLQKLGPVPPDLIAHLTSLPEATVVALRNALTDVKDDEALCLACNDLFQATELGAVATTDYDALRKDLEDGESKNLFAS